MKKRILCLTDGFSLGGAERQLIGLAHYLKGKGYDADLCSYLKRDFYSDLISSYELKSECLDVKGGKLSKLYALYKYVKRGNYDWVIAYKDGATMAACLLKLLGLRFRLIVSERNTNISRSKGDNLKFFLYSLSDYIVPNSFSQQDFIKSNFPRLKKKVVTITNFTDTNYFSPSATTPGNFNDVIKIVVAARIAEQKNIIRFLRVVKKLKECRLQFKVSWYGNVSNGEERYESLCCDLIQQYGISDVFEFLPATNDILEVYRQCTVFCLPSLFEGFPNALCEAMSCGKPILCSRVCDNSMIVEEGKNGMMFNPEDENEMFEVIRTFITQPVDRITDMCMESRRLAERKFSEEGFIEKYIKLIES